MAWLARAPKKLPVPSCAPKGSLDFSGSFSPGASSLLTESINDARHNQELVVLHIPSDSSGEEMWRMKDGRAASIKPSEAYAVIK